MGNKASLDIHLDQQESQAGQPISGIITLQVPKKFKSTGMLELEIKGKEKTRTKKRQICHIRLLLRRFEGKLNKGFYSFPFTLDLPASLPSSMAHEKNFRIEYRLSAGINGELRKHCPLSVISAPLPLESVPCMVQPTSRQVKAAGLLNKGHLAIGASVTNSQVGRGQDIDLNLACRNDSTAVIRRVEIKLIEKLEWPKASSEITHLYLPDVDLPGLDKAKKAGFLLRRRRVNPVDDSVSYREIFHELISGRSRIALRVPETARDTFKGQLIKVSHTLEIRLNTGSWVHVKDPVIVIPIRVGTPPWGSPEQGSPQEQSQRVTINHTSHLQQPIAHHPFHSAEFPQLDYIPITVTHHHDGESVQGQASVVPMATAVVISDDLSRRGNHVPSSDRSVIVLGGSVICQDDDSESIEDLSDLVPIPPPGMASNNVSLPRLYFEMSQSISDYDMILGKLENAAWRTLFRGLTPEQFGGILLRVNNDFDQARVAALLAPYIEVFTCEYAVAAVRVSCEWNCSTVVRRLLPFCVDIKTQFGRIRNELSEWDRTVTERDFQLAISGGGGGSSARW